MNPVDDLAIPAVRYGLGRRTYITGLISDTLIAHRHMLTVNTKDVIVRDITEAEEYDGLGMDCDAEAWKRLREALR